MLPNTGTGIPKRLRVVEQASKTYSMNVDRRQILGICDGLDAVKQAAYCILNTERYEYLIYSWNYGIELKDLYGRPMTYVKSELKRRIREALLQDKRIKSVENFSFSSKGNSLAASFTVHSAAGMFDMTKEVRI